MSEKVSTYCSRQVRGKFSRSFCIQVEGVIVDMKESRVDLSDPAHKLWPSDSYEV